VHQATLRIDNAATDQSPDGYRIHLGDLLSGISTPAENGKDFARTLTAKRYATTKPIPANCPRQEHRRRHGHRHRHLVTNRLLVQGQTVRGGSQTQLENSHSAISTPAENGKDFANTQTEKKFAIFTQTRANYRRLERNRRRHVLLDPNHHLAKGLTVQAGTPTQQENTHFAISTLVGTGKNSARTPTEKKFPTSIQTQANYLHQSTED
jgi:hypothetical protein